MEIKLKTGESLTITFDNTDGKFEVHFDSDEHPFSLLIKEVDGLPGNVCGLASAVLYEENWSSAEYVDDVDDESDLITDSSGSSDEGDEDVVLLHHSEGHRGGFGFCGKG